MKKLFTILLLAITIYSFSQNTFRGFIDSVYSIEDPVARAAYVESFEGYADTSTTPIIEGDTAYFIYEVRQHRLVLQATLMDGAILHPGI
jgi:hypothetical protein